jgi:hypothetical protein
MNFKNRKIRIGRYTISALLLLLIIGSAVVFATAYVILTWTMTATVVANPKVCFINWTNGALANTFSYSVNIFPSVTTIDQNITYGVENWDTTTHTVSMSWASLTTPTNIASLNVTVYNSTTTLYSQYWASVPALPTAYVNFSPSPSPGNYTIWMSIGCASGASPGTASTFTFNMQVMNP